MLHMCHGQGDNGLTKLCTRFHAFFNQIDQFKANHFLWLTAGGLKVAEINKEESGGKSQNVDKQLGDEDEEDPDGGQG